MSAKVSDTPPQAPTILAPTVLAPTIHACAVLVGARALLIRGPAGAGKSRLALELIQAAACGRLAFVRLIADDRVHVAAAHGRLIAHAPANLAGLLEIRGIGIRRLPYEPMAVVASWSTSRRRQSACRKPPRRRSKACGCRVLRSHRARTPFPLCSPPSH